MLNKSNSMRHFPSLLTDHVFDQILNQSDSNSDLDEARSILKDIVNRRLPKFVGEARLQEDKLKVPYRSKKTHLLCVKDNNKTIVLN